jgi:hypothetical protein
VVEVEASEVADSIVDVVIIVLGGVEVTVVLLVVLVELAEVAVAGLLVVALVGGEAVERMKLGW